MAAYSFSRGEVDALAGNGVGVAGDVGVRARRIGGVGGEEKIVYGRGNRYYSK